MSDVYYGDKPIEEVNSYYKINIDGKWSDWGKRLKECEKIQRAFQDKGIYLILRECEDMYKIWSDEIYCAGWEGGLEDRSEDDIFELLLPWLKNIIADRLNRFEVIYNQLKENKFIK